VFSVDFGAFACENDFRQLRGAHSVTSLESGSTGRSKVADIENAGSLTIPRRVYSMSKKLERRPPPETPPWVKAGLSLEKYTELRGLGQDSETAYRVTLQRMYEETARYLESLSRLVHEGKSVSEAANFARWVQFSGLPDLLDRFALPGQKFPSLSRRLTDLLQECGDHFRGGRVDVKYSESDIAEINRKLDVLLSQAAHAPGDRSNVDFVVPRVVFPG